MLTNVTVEAHAKNGLCVSFNGGVYRGSLDEDHLGGHRGLGVNRKKKGGGETKDGGDPSMWWKGVFKGKLARVRTEVGLQM